MSKSIPVLSWENEAAWELVIEKKPSLKISWRELQRMNSSVVKNLALWLEWVDPNIILKHIKLSDVRKIKDTDYDISAEAKFTGEDLLSKYHTRTINDYMLRVHRDSEDVSQLKNHIAEYIKYICMLIYETLSEWIATEEEIKLVKESLRTHDILCYISSKLEKSAKIQEMKWPIHLS
jgi:hypothetical protein